MRCDRLLTLRKQICGDSHNRRIGLEVQWIYLLEGVASFVMQLRVDRSIDTQVEHRDSFEQEGTMVGATVHN